MLPAALQARLEALGLHQAGSEDDSVATVRVDYEWCTPTAVFLGYCGSSRAVTMRSVWADPNCGARVVGHCHLRADIREFRGDRIDSIICLNTGEHPDDPIAWLLGHALRGSAASALAALRPELTVLSFIAQSDGVLDPDEVEVITDFVMMNSQISIDDLGVVRERIARLTPSEGQLPIMAGQIAKSPERLENLKRAMRRLVDADREYPATEQIAVAEIERRLERSQQYQRERNASKHSLYASLFGAPD